MRVLFAKLGLALALGAALLSSGCSSGTAKVIGPAGDKFAVVSINVISGSQWQINRAINITFNHDVDLSTVNFNSINLVNAQGKGATGVFSQPIDATGNVNRRVVRFQPKCPTKVDFSDAGLLPNNEYRLTVKGSLTGGTAVADTAGKALEVGAVVEFNTPDSDDALVLFVDTTAGPPVVVVRGLNDDPSLPSSSLVLGGIERDFEWSTDPVGEPFSLRGRLGFEVPLNHYSIDENQLQVFLLFNQPVDASPTNISSQFIRLEYRVGAYDNAQAWQVMPSELELVANCTEVGAAVRVRPLGIVPQDSDLRITLKQGFRDLIGDGTTSDRSDFTFMHTVTAGADNPLHAGVDNPEVDDLLDSFAFSGGEIGSLEDTQAVFDVPSAKWGAGQLQAAFDFNGTGGPGGDFDWIFPPATEIVLDTVSDTIFSATGSQAVINGLVDIRNMRIPAGSRLRIVGPNTCTILCSGTVEIYGEITINGSDHPGVVSLNTANQPEQGSKGNGGGGDGGIGSFLTTQSTPRGGRGFGAFGVPNLGGEGGETSYANTGKVDRRGAGGGGGVLGDDYYFLHEVGAAAFIRAQTLPGLDVEPGAPGGPGGLGAVSQAERAVGGKVGPSPFLDNDPNNNFLGTMISPTNQVILGELDGLLAGAGGGGGGDAVNSDSFPKLPFMPSGDEKGCGGGGGAGGLRILAIDNITIGHPVTHDPGFISAEGGDGGGGENTSFFDRVGGGSGAGSGGHIVISTAKEIHVYGRAAANNNPGFWYRDGIGNAFHSRRPISAVGGQGGAGNQSAGGANENGASTWKCDSIPTFFDGGLGGTVPPFKPQGTFVCFHAQPDKPDASGFWTIGAGGDGGPGIIQIHVNDPATDLVLHDAADQSNHYMTGQDVSDIFAPPPIGWKSPSGGQGDPDWTPPNRMVPFFGRNSKAQSKWIPLGLARVDPGPPPGTDDINFTFLGTNVADGIVENDGNDQVQFVTPLLGPVAAAKSFTMTLDATGLTNPIYAANPRLLEGFTVRLEDAGDPMVFEMYRIVSATFTAGAPSIFTVNLDPNGPNPATFIPNPYTAYLVPHFVRVVTNGIADAYPDATAIKVDFQAATVDAQGAITPGPWETDIDNLNNPTPWDLVRFRVEFDLAKNALPGDTIDITTPRPGLDHLRLHFDF